MHVQALILLVTNNYFVVPVLQQVAHLCSLVQHVLTRHLKLLQVTPANDAKSVNYMYVSTNTYGHFGTQFLRHLPLCATLLLKCITTKHPSGLEITMAPRRKLRSIKKGTLFLYKQSFTLIFLAQLTYVHLSCVLGADEKNVLSP